MISYMTNIPIRMQQWEHSFFAFFHGFKKMKFLANDGRNKQHHKNQLHTIIKKFISSLQTCYSKKSHLGLCMKLRWKCSYLLHWKNQDFHSSFINFSRCKNFSRYQFKLEIVYWNFVLHKVVCFFFRIKIATYVF